MNKPIVNIQGLMKIKKSETGKYIILTPTNKFEIVDTKEKAEEYSKNWAKLHKKNAINALLVEWEL